MTQQEAASATARHTVQANGLNIYYQEYGNGEPLLLLHGDTATSRMWMQHAPQFAKHFRVIAPDRRGHGRTKNPGDTLSYHLEAEDMVAVIQALRLTRPLVCGYSGGGTIALEMAMNYAGLVKAYVVGGTSYRRLPQFFELWRGMGVDGPGVVDFERLERDNAGMVKRLQENHDVHQDEGYWKIYMRQMSLFAWAPLKYSVEDLRKIVDPVLLLIGDREEFYPVEDNVHMYRTIPGAELAVVPNSAHLFPIDNAELFTSLSLDFLLRHSADSKQV